MVDDSGLKKIKLNLLVEPDWCRSIVTMDDPIKLPHSKQYCPCCNRYCIYDYFRNTWLTDAATSKVLEIGKGEEGREITDFACLMRTCRNGAYNKLWVSYLSKILPPDQHGWLNDCIVSHVMRYYPDPHSDYTGYEYTIDHMNHMIALKQGVARAAEESSSSSSEENEFIDEAV